MATKIKSVPRLTGKTADKFNKMADNALKNKGTLDFSKNIEIASKILAKAKI